MGLEEKLQQLKAKKETKQPLIIPSLISKPLVELTETHIKVQLTRERQIEVTSDWLTDEQLALILESYESFLNKECMIWVELKQVSNGFLPYCGIRIEQTIPPKVAVFKKLSDVEDRPIDYLHYRIGGNQYYVQRDGIFTICGTTGTGKTYSALANIKLIQHAFEEILYLNWEITENDLKQRALQMGIDISKITVSDSQSTDDIIEYIGTRSVCIIVDNIDNLVGEDDTPFNEQLKFIKRMDKHAKDNNQHVLMLTQHVKDSKMKVFDKKGKFTDDVTVNVLSGVKQLSNMARSVVFISYFEGNDSAMAEYKSKFVKKGSGKYEKEIISQKLSRV